MWKWIFSNVAAGAFRWSVAAIISAVCLIIGFSPETWIKAIIESPPLWLINELTRLGFVVFGVFIIIVVFFWDRSIKQRQRKVLGDPDAIRDQADLAKQERLQDKQDQVREGLRGGGSNRMQDTNSPKLVILHDKIRDTEWWPKHDGFNVKFRVYNDSDVRAEKVGGRIRTLEFLQEGEWRPYAHDFAGEPLATRIGKSEFDLRGGDEESVYIAKRSTRSGESIQLCYARHGIPNTISLKPAWRVGIRLVSDNAPHKDAVFQLRISDDGSLVGTLLDGEPVEETCAAKAQRDVWLLDAIHFVAFGSWERREWNDLGGSLEILYTAAKDIEQAALDALVPIWGKQGFSGKYIGIAAMDWADYQIEDTSILRGDPEQLYARRTNKRSLPAQYGALKTSKAGIERWHAANTSA